MYVCTYLDTPWRNCTEGTSCTIQSRSRIHRYCLRAQFLICRRRTHTISGRKGYAISLFENSKTSGIFFSKNIVQSAACSWKHIPSICVRSLYGYIYDGWHIIWVTSQTPWKTHGSSTIDIGAGCSWSLENWKVKPGTFLCRVAASLRAKLERACLSTRRFINGSSRKDIVE